MSMRRRAWAVLIATALLAGCAAQQAYRRAEIDSRRENWDQAVLGYSKALAMDPGNTRYGVALERAKLKASAQHFEKGKRYSAAGQWDLAVAEFQQTLLLNPGNQHANTELERALREIQRRDAGPSPIELMKERARRKALAPPKLSPKSNIPIVMHFREKPPIQIFEALSKASGINFLFDDKVAADTKPITIDVGNVTLEKALDILMLQTKNFYKVVDEHTLLIAPDTRQKRQELEDMVIRTFYLSNGDTKQVVTLLRSLLNSRQIAENPALNSVTIRDTPDKAAIAERIIQANDKSKGEIIIDVELLEINRTVARNLGIDLSPKSLALSFRDGKQSVPLNNLRVLRQQGNWFVGTIPSVILNFLKTDSDSKTIAKPQLRVSEGEKAEILIGDRVPIPTTSFNTSQTIGGNIVPITSFTYQNVGITVQLEPRVHHNKEVTLKVNVEISQLAGSVATGGGQSQPIIGTRNIQTVIRLRDGETNLLAGLIRREDSDDRSGIPGVLDLPGINRVFSNSNSRKLETDIIMTLTPYIIRIPDITEADMATLWVGTEENMRLRGGARSGLEAGPFDREEEELPLPGATEASMGARRPGTVSRMAPSREQGGSPGRTPEPPPEPAPDVPPAGEDVPGGPADAGAGGGETGVVPTPGGTEVPGEVPPPDEGGDPGEDADDELDEGEDVDVPPDQPPAEDEENPPPDQAQDRPQPTGPVTVRLVPSAPSYKVGETVVVEVRIENAHNTGSVPFHLRYNRNVLEFLPPAEQGPFLSSDGANTIFMARDAAGGGEVVVGLSRMGTAEGATGAGTLATFRFQAVNPGEAGFAFTGATVKDPQARNLPATFASAAVQVEP